MSSGTGSGLAQRVAEHVRGAFVGEVTAITSKPGRSWFYAVGGNGQRVRVTVEDQSDG